MKRMKRLCSGMLCLLLILSLPGLLAAATPIEPDPVLTPDQILKLVDAQYRKVSLEKIRNDFTYFKNAGPVRASAIKKYYDPNPAPPKAPCGFEPHLFVRRNRLDTFQLRENAVPLKDAKGAALNFTDDMVTSTNTLAINGRIQYLMDAYDGITPCAERGTAGKPFDPLVAHYGYAIAPFVDAQGLRNNPIKRGEVNNLQTGVDLQLSIFGGKFFDHQYAIATPYYQTDFHGDAEAVGIRVAWEPVAPDIHLGGYIGVPKAAVDGYWQVQAEFDAKDVSKAGTTGLRRGDFQWLGGTAQLHLTFFNGRSQFDPFWVPIYPAALEDRLFFNAVFNAYKSLVGDASIHWFETELGYNISKDGKSSLSTKYVQGVDKDTFATTQKFLVALNLKL